MKPRTGVTDMTIGRKLLIGFGGLMGLGVIGSAFSAPTPPQNSTPVVLSSNVTATPSPATPTPTVVPTPTATPPPTSTPTPKPTVAAASNCDPNYSGACVPIASDVDCAGGSGNGPAYVAGPVKVIGVDKYDLDRDGNGWGCE
jgi:hypothetical protein